MAKVLDSTFNAAKEKPRVRLAADDETNSLLVKASPIDVIAIRRLLLELESAEADAAPATGTWVIGPLKHASAADVREVLEALYRTGKGPASLLVTAEARTNALVLRCTRALFEEVRMLVEELDRMAADKKK
jgi:type II secretory pathway component GspD/PulD (secretin)